MYQGNKVDEMHAAALPTATHPYTRTLWTCRPNAQTYGADAADAGQDGNDAGEIP